MFLQKQQVSVKAHVIYSEAAEDILADGFLMCASNLI